MSNTVYLEYHFVIRPLQPFSDILIAELGEIGFESFVEKENGLLAYILKEDWHPKSLDKVRILSNENLDISYTIKEIEQENWNAIWEENFKPIHVGDACMVRAPFHDEPTTGYDIVIAPKMSFGTGHHETTHMMLQHILDTDFKGRSVLDMGSGTGVLAILAEKKGASKVDAIDIDTWSYLNAKENVARNQCKNITVYEGNVALLSNKVYDIILANINRNILLEDIPQYAKSLKKGGLLFLSGFYEDDIEVIIKKCEKHQLIYRYKYLKNRWIAIKLKKY